MAQTNGKATVTVETSPGRKGQLIRLDYDDESFAVPIGPDGIARIDFALLQQSNSFTVRGGEMRAAKCKIDFPDIAKFYRVVLRWHDPVRVDLHTIEPGSSNDPAAIGHIHRAAPNTASDRGAGTLDIVTDPGTPGATGEQSYVVAKADKPPGRYNFRADYVSRGDAPTGEYCDKGSLASIELTLISIEDGKAQPPKKYVTGALPCGQPIDAETRLIRLR